MSEHLQPGRREWPEWPRKLTCWAQLCRAAGQPLLVVGCAWAALLGCTSKSPAPNPTEMPTDDQSSVKNSAPSQATETSAGDKRSSILLRQVSDSKGLDFVHCTGQRGKFLLPETMTGGVALFDYDADGLIDIYFCSGRPLLSEAGQLLYASSNLLDTSSNSAPAVGGALYRNLGNWQFVDVTASAGLKGVRFGLGVTAADYDNDGFADLFLSNFDGDQLYQNDGQGGFVNVTAELGSSVTARFSAGASFVDVNQDDSLDLFVARYVQLGLDDIVEQGKLGRTQYPGPQDFRPETSLLLLSTGERGGWIDATSQSGIASVSGTGMGCVTGDFDDDGDTDIFVANDEMPNYFYRNDGRGNFEEAGLIMGAAVNSMGAPSGSMGVDAGDLDGDGRADLFVTTFENEYVNLFRMTEQQMFQEVTRQTRVGEGSLPQVSWGCCLADLDCDGDRDLYIATGHLDQRHQNAYYRVADMIMGNLQQETGQFRFENVTAASADVAGMKGVSRGSAVADLDQDGDQDIVVLNIDDRPALLDNRSPKRHWLKLRLVGTRAVRDALGAKIRIQAGKLSLVDEVRNGRGYQSYWGSQLHFGLGSQSVCDQITIIWPSGDQQVLTAVPADQELLIVEP